MIGEAVSSPDDGRGPMRRLLGESGDMTGSAFEKTTAEGEFVLPGSGPCERVIVTFYHPGGAQAIELREGEPLEVGRDPRADLRLDVESLSRKHARFVLEKGAIWVEDLGSRNGTLIQGERIGRASLEAGTAVSLGGVVAFVQRLPLGAKKVSYDGKAIVTSSATAAMWQEVQRVAPTDLPVLILGETGVGKEVVAAALHERHDTSERHRRSRFQRSAPDAFPLNQRAVARAEVLDPDCPFFEHEASVLAGKTLDIQA